METSDRRFIKFYANFVPEGPPPRIRVHQYTHGEIAYLTADMRYGTDKSSFDNNWWSTVLQSKKAYLSFKRPDGKKFKQTINASNIHSGSEISIPIPIQMTVVPGPVAATIGFDDSAGNVIWSQNFMVDVEPAPVKDTDLEQSINDPTEKQYIDAKVESEVDKVSLAVDSNGILYLKRS